MIDIPPATFRVTPYGEVDATALDHLREHFDTSTLLQLVERLDVCLADMGGVVAVRDELLRLHAMTLTIVEGAVLSVPTENCCIWAEAESLQLDLEALALWVRSAQLCLAPLLGLVPDHDK